MGHFRGTLQGYRGEGSRLGSKDSGLKGRFNGWGIRVDLRAVHNKESGKDCIIVDVSGGSNNKDKTKRKVTWNEKIQSLCIEETD